MTKAEKAEAKRIENEKAELAAKKEQALAEKQAQKEEQKRQEALKKEEQKAQKEKEKADKQAELFAKKEADKAKKEAELREKSEAKKAQLEQKAQAAEKAKAEKLALREANRMPEQNGVRRPKPDGACGQAWALFDETAMKKGSPPAISECLDEAVKRDLNINNVRIEYSLWKKFYGITQKIVAPKKEIKQEKVQKETV